MKTRTLLIDGNYLVKRSFHGDKTSHNKNGQHIGAIYSFYTTLRKLIKENLSTKVVLMWDGEQGGLARYKIDPAYKANRKNKDWKHNIELSDAEIKLELKKEQSFLYQKKRIQAYAEELFIRQIEINEIEADDLIAEYCLRHSENEDIVLFTNDRDFLQLLDETRKQVLTKYAVIENDAIKIDENQKVIFDSEEKEKECYIELLQLSKIDFDRKLHIFSLDDFSEEIMNKFNDEEIESMLFMMEI